MILGASAAAAPVVAMSDFSAVQSVSAAKRLVAEGRLVPVLLFPTELGGEQVAANIVYITPPAAKARESIVQELLRPVARGSLDTMKVKPAYKGRSVVPARIVFEASHTVTHGTFKATLPVW